jgi:hypothetical protein
MQRALRRKQCLKSLRGFRMSRIKPSQANALRANQPRRGALQVDVKPGTVELQRLRAGVQLARHVMAGCGPGHGASAILPPGLHLSLLRAIERPNCATSADTQPGAKQITFWFKTSCTQAAKRSGVNNPVPVTLKVRSRRCSRLGKRPLCINPDRRRGGKIFIYRLKSGSRSPHGLS